MSKIAGRDSNPCPVLRTKYLKQFAASKVHWAVDACHHEQEIDGFGIVAIVDRFA